MDDSELELSRVVLQEISWEQQKWAAVTSVR